MGETGGKFEIRNSKFEGGESWSVPVGVARIRDLDRARFGRQIFWISDFGFRIYIFHRDWILAEVHYGWKSDEQDS
jgi:hypothetical protein